MNVTKCWKNWVIYLIIFRYETRRSVNFQNDTNRETSNDVLCNFTEGNSFSLQEIHDKGNANEINWQPFEIFVDNEDKLTLHGLQQFYVSLKENEKNRKLNDILDMLQFNQVIIFVKNIVRCVELNKLLIECNFPSIAIHGSLEQDER